MPRLVDIDLQQQPGPSFYFLSFFPFLSPSSPSLFFCLYLFLTHALPSSQTHDSGAATSADGICLPSSVTDPSDVAAPRPLPEEDKKTHPVQAREGNQQITSQETFQNVPPPPPPPPLTAVLLFFSRRRYTLPTQLLRIFTRHVEMEQLGKSSRSVSHVHLVKSPQRVVPGSKLGRLLADPSHPIWSGQICGWLPLHSAVFNGGC